MVCLVSRTGRHLQRYNDKGRRLVVGCIPYRFKGQEKDKVNNQVEVLVISSQNGQGMMFPKGGWELDESLIEAACRESLEEAGVLGNVEDELGIWGFKSKSQGTYHEGYMFPLLVTEQLDLWPEQNVRKRVWMTVAEAREVCKHWWMKEALDKFVNRLLLEELEDQQQDLPAKSLL
ncbi:nudix hydrolase 17, mitochondrial [Coffea arabica]|uniref:Nudix hydrolase 17, mitochondrial n=1 Tax=Coffea arabica TaxID=13443 RepID=A0A6P6V840_COFAR|nr:nudix hydrolase 17, mitochondrial-like [Coffea arabica]